tara:strand:+ start:1941 stop:3476 length:1536 start_codon:yes stop_codon:yes gene_type:complete
MAGDPLVATDFAYRSSLPGGVSFNNPLSNGGAGRLVLPIWAGEVIHAYDQYNIFEGLVESKTISSGTTMEFPVTGYVDLNAAWNAGEELVGGTDAKSTTFRVALDKRPMAAHFELDNVDQMLTQWEFRSELARQAGRTLADARDRQIGVYIARAASEEGLAADPRATDQFGFSAVGGLSGKVFCNSLFDNLGKATATAAQRTDAALKLLEKIEEFQIRLQEVDAPTEGVYCAVDPRTFQDIRALGVARDSSDLAGGAGRPLFGGVADAGGLGAGLGQGMFALADRLEYQGCSIIKTNHMPNKNYTTAAGNIGDVRYNRSCHVCPVKALIWQQGCIASLKMTGLKVDQVDDIRRNTVFTVASMMGGTGVLKPEHAAVCIGTPGKDNGADGTADDVAFEGQCVHATNFAARHTFGDFNFDTTTFDLINFDASAGGGDGATNPTGDISNADATFDLETNNMYAASLGATHIGAGAADAVAITDAIAGSMYYEYQTAPNNSIFGTLAEDDGLGSA